MHLLHLPVMSDGSLQFVSQRAGACQDVMFNPSGALGLAG